MYMKIFSYVDKRLEKYFDNNANQTGSIAKKKKKKKLEIYL